MMEMMTRVLFEQVIVYVLLIVVLSMFTIILSKLSTIINWVHLERHELDRNKEECRIAVENEERIQSQLGDMAQQLFTAERRLEDTEIKSRDLITHNLELMDQLKELTP